MKQQRSFAFTRAPRPKPGIKRQADRYQPANETAAAIILADPARYPAESLPAKWAAAWQERFGPVADELARWERSRKALRSFW